LPEQADGADALAAAQKFATSKPKVARTYDYLLGGTDHFAADRQAAEQLIALIPNVATLAKAKRTFLAAAVRQVARAGIRQYLDIGLPPQRQPEPTSVPATILAAVGRKSA
jgi:hypothetical protein